MADLCTRSCFRSELGGPDPLQDALAKIGLLTTALNSSPCPRPVNTAPHSLTVEECIKRGECGCDNRAAITGHETGGRNG